MSKVIDELKELEARRQEIYDYARTQHNRTESFGEILDAHDYSNAPTYRRLALELAEEHEDLGLEQRRWQDAIAELITEECGVEVDGGGCDSGDPLDFTLSEINQGLMALNDRIYDLEQSQPIIFSPSDPRVRVGGEYEFSNSYDFGPDTDAQTAKGTLDYTLMSGTHPFRMKERKWKTLEGYYTFLRELPKEERGEGNDE